MKICVIICNPQSGKINKEKLLFKFKKILWDYGYKTEIKYTKKSKDAINIIKSLPKVDLVIAAGGDGTLNEVLNGNLSRKEKLLIANLPLGTTNDVGKMYGYTKNYCKDLKMLLSGIIKNIDTCKINDKGFVYVSCFGNYVDIAYNTPRKLKKTLGKAAYFLRGFKEATNRVKTYGLNYKVNGIESYGNYSFIFITNSSSVGGIKNFVPNVKLDDNAFEVIFCKLTNKFDIIKSLIYIIAGKIHKAKGIEYYKTDKLEIVFDDQDIAWCVDGEEYKLGTNKYNFSINKDINMLVPYKHINNLFEKGDDDGTKF